MYFFRKSLRFRAAEKSRVMFLWLGGDARPDDLIRQAPFFSVDRIICFVICTFTYLHICTSTYSNAYFSPYTIAGNKDHVSL